MNNKLLIFMICLSSWILSSCATKDKLDPPYLKALHNLRDMNNTFSQIIYQQNNLKFNNTKVRLHGYINHQDHRIYMLPDFDDPLLDDEEFRNSESILLFENYQNKKLIDISQCKANDSLIEIHGTFHVQKSANNDDSFYLTDISKIYDFDTRPISKGGTGEKILCYSIQK